MIYSFLLWIGRTLPRLYLGDKFTLRGREAIPRRGPLMVCSNHISNLDAVLVPAFLPRSDSWSMAKAEWFKPPLLAWLFSLYHAFPVIRHTPDRQSLRRAQAVLERGEVLIIYPEGTRNSDGRLIRAHAGAGFLARMNQVTIQPVALVGSQDCFPKGAWWPRRRPVEIRWGAPLRINKQRPEGERISNQEAADAIMLAIARLLPEEMRGIYSNLEEWEQQLSEVSSELPSQMAD